MELNWTTFFLEMINFIVLVWLLKRFFYKPVRQAVEDRRIAIEKTLLDAEEARKEADRLRLQFEGRLEEWVSEKEHHRAEFLAGLEKEKQGIYARFQKQMENERAESALIEKRKGEEIAARAEKEAFSISMGFLKGMLERIADPGMETRLIDLTLERLSEDGTIYEASGISGPAGTPLAKIRSAYPLDPAQQERLVNILKGKTGRDLTCSWEVDSGLIAGLEITLGPYVIEANLKNEMRYFSGIETA